MYLTQLEFLDLSRNAIEQLPQDIGNLYSLRWMWITYNQIEFGDNIYKLESLVEVKVEREKAAKLTRLESFMFHEVESCVFRRKEARENNNH